MEEAKNFKVFHEALEGDLKRLAREVEQERKIPEGVSFSEKEILKRSIEKLTVNIEPVQKEIVDTPRSGEPSVGSGILPAYLQGKNVEPEVRLEVEKLIDFVFHANLEKALREARKHPPFVQDAFHDALVDRLLPLLKERGFLK